MEQVTAYCEAIDTGGMLATILIAQHSHGESRVPLDLKAKGRSILSTAIALDGSWSAQILWPTPKTLPNAAGTWRHEGGQWVPHDPKTEAALLTQEIIEPDHIRLRREARIKPAHTTAGVI